MKAENITLDDAEVAWFFKQKLNLTEMQKQMLETTLSGMTEAYADVERESVRILLPLRAQAGSLLVDYSDGHGGRLQQVPRVDNVFFGLWLNFNATLYSWSRGIRLASAGPSRAV
ncbi:unnamed protein product [Durusdinium trenchii]|uniref:Uncharacterized protein n=1 Tax=Durusdinium trenchii TaxID=1381693 RepID=A0ABP0SH56_9DINO